MSKHTQEQLDFINYNDSKSLILAATAGSGKEQPLFSKVLTPSGWKRMGDLKVGESIITPTGEKSKIVNIYPQGVKPVYKTNFSDDSYTHAGKEHLWKVEVGLNTNIFEHLTTEQIMSRLDKENLYIPLTKIENKSSYTYHFNPKKVGDLLKKYITSIPISFTEGYDLLDILKIFENFTIFNHNEIYSDISYSINDRVDIIKAFFDLYELPETLNGSIKLNDKCIPQTEKIINSITSIINSIGGIVYRSDIIDEIKLNIVFNKKDEQYRCFHSIEYFDDVKCQCIEIDHPDHLYVTDNFIVTHNTYCCVGRLNKLIEDGVDPSRIIFFSFTNDAVNELKSRITHNVEVTTIHSFCARLLGKMKKFKNIITLYDFVNWYKETYKPKMNDPRTIKDIYYQTLDIFYEDGNSISSSFSAYKLQFVEGIKLPKPDFYPTYEKFMKETKSRDFSDMLIDTEKLSKNPDYKIFFEGLYDHVFIDEYQDTSTLQLKILLTIKAKQYYLIGDRFQSIFGFSGANCELIEDLLEKSHEVQRMTLSKNFRSDKNIVAHSNKFSDIKAIPNSENDGDVHYNLIDMFELLEMVSDGKPLTMLARSNKTIKELEFEFLKKKVKMRYFNYFTPTDIEMIKTGKANQSIKKRLDKIIPYFISEKKLLEFIEEYENSNVFITSIHKSKGREFPRCVVINSIDPELAEKHKISNEFTYLTKAGDIIEEEKNIHYVAVTRPKHEIYFMIYDLKKK